MEEEKTNRLKKANEKEGHRRKNDCRENLIASKDDNCPFRADTKPRKKTCGLTVCVTCVWAGVDNAWEQEKLEARKMLENAAESHTSGARFVSCV